MCRRIGLEVFTQENVGKCRWRGESGVCCQVVSSVFLKNMIFLSYTGHCFRQKPEILFTKMKKSNSRKEPVGENSQPNEV